MKKLERKKKSKNSNLNVGIFFFHAQLMRQSHDVALKRKTKTRINKV